MLIVRCYVNDYIAPRQYDPAMTGQESREKPSRGSYSPSLLGEGWGEGRRPLTDDQLLPAANAPDLVQDQADRAQGDGAVRCIEGRKVPVARMKAQEVDDVPVH